MKYRPHPLMVEARRLREEAGLSQTDVAELCGYSLMSIHRLEVGMHAPSVPRFSDHLRSLGYRLKIEPIEGAQ